MMASFFDHLQDPLSSYLQDSDKQKLLQDHFDDLFFATSLNLDAVAPLLNSLYSPIERRPHRDPKPMLRSLLLMIHHQQTRITHWVEQTREDPLLALLAGFNPDETPGIGTYYDFIDRLVDGPYQKPCDHIVKPSSLLPKKFLRSLKQESQQKKDQIDPNHPQSETLVDHLLANSHQPRPNDPLKLLEDLLIQLAFIPSIQHGLVELSNLTVADDGSILESHASAYPKPVCECRKKGLYRCDCPKPYRSSTATWCYDSYRDTFLFGDRCYSLVTHQNGSDLPLLSLLSGGNESDFTLSLKAFDRLLKACKENHLDLYGRYFIGDCHHPTNPHYRYFASKSIPLISPLPENSQNVLIQIEGIKTDDQASPLCPTGAKMRHHQFDQKDLTHVYACPAKRLTRKKGRYSYLFNPPLCPLKQDCAPQSPNGPWLRIPAKDNLRLFPPIPRSSNRFELLYHERTSTERIHNSYKNVYHLPKSSRAAPRRQVRLFLTNIVQHAALWLRKAKESLPNSQLLQACLDKLGLKFPTPDLPQPPPTPNSLRPLRPKISNPPPPAATTPPACLNTG